MDVDPAEPQDAGVYYSGDDSLTGADSAVIGVWVAELQGLDAGISWYAGP